VVVLVIIVIVIVNIARGSITDPNETRSVLFYSITSRVS
jgi:hypothetical protein